MHIPAPNDVFMLAKERMHSKHLCQPPLLVLPSACFRQLPDADRLGACPRNPLTAVKQKEFLKTAKKVESWPWHLHEAARYLRELVRTNVAREWPEPAALSFVFDHYRMSRLSLSGLQMCPELAQFAPGTPRRVRVQLPAVQVQDPPAQHMPRPPAIIDDDPDEECSVCDEVGHSVYRAPLNAEDAQRPVTQDLQPTFKELVKDSQNLSIPMKQPFSSSL